MATGIDFSRYAPEEISAAYIITSVALARFAQEGDIAAIREGFFEAAKGADENHLTRAIHLSTEMLELAQQFVANPDKVELPLGFHWPPPKKKSQ